MTGDDHTLRRSSFSKSVNALVLLPWKLNKLYLEVANSILHLLEVLLHLFILALIVAINLAGYYLGIAVHDQIFSSCHLGKVQPRYQGFVLCFVIGHREVKTDHAFDLISFRAVEYHTSSTCLPIGGSVCVDAPLWDLFCPLAFPESEFCDEVSYYLPLYGRAWSILYVEFTQLYCPQCHPSCSFKTTHSSMQGLVR